MVSQRPAKASRVLSYTGSTPVLTASMQAMCYKERMLMPLSREMSRIVNTGSSSVLTLGGTAP